MNITTIGIDLAKNTFSVCGCNAHGKVLFRKSLRRLRGLLSEFGIMMPLSLWPMNINPHGCKLQWRRD